MKKGVKKVVKKSLDSKPLEKKAVRDLKQEPTETIPKENPRDYEQAIGYLTQADEHLRQGKYMNAASKLNQAYEVISRSINSNKNERSQVFNLIITKAKKVIEEGEADKRELDWFVSKTRTNSIEDTKKLIDRIGKNLGYYDRAKPLSTAVAVFIIFIIIGLFFLSSMVLTGNVVSSSNNEPLNLVGAGLFIVGVIGLIGSLILEK